MKITVSIGNCTATVDDGNATEPASGRWKDQFQNIKEALAEVTKSVIDMHKQQMGDKL